jgi:hypothetical protein
VDNEQVLQQIESLCQKFSNNCSDNLNFDVSEVEDLLKSLFSRFENSPLLYFSVNPGWFSILADLHKKLLFIDPDYTIFQIKEKFGGLRFYATFKNISPVSESIAHDLIALAEQRSCHSCEICGKYGTLSDDRSWKSTRCSAHKDSMKDF